MTQRHPHAPCGASDSAASAEQGRRALAENKPEQAVAHLLEAIEVAPDHAELHCLLAQAYLLAGEPDEAHDSYTMALHHAPDCLDAYLGLGSLLAQHGRHDEAVTLYTDGLERLPGAAELHTNLALQLFETDRPEDALAACHAALACNPQLFEAWHNLGYVKLHLDDPQGAIEAFDRALVLRPEVLATMTSRGHALRDTGQVDQALTMYRDVLARDPSFEDALRNLACTQLLRGELKAGWRNYEWRFGASGRLMRGFPFPAWRGEPLAGKSILVLAEQGIGDEIMFASCVPDVMRDSGRCVIECNTRLGALYRRSFPQAHVHAAEKNAPRDWLQRIGAIDYQVLIGDLPRHLRSRSEDFPAHRGYLVADPERVERWRGRMADSADGLPTIGIAWRGGSLKTRNRSRSLPLPLLAPLLQSIDARWVSLQRGTLPQSEEAFLRDHGVLRPSLQEGEEIEEHAALLAVLDQVVSIDTSVVHLAGALGRPVCVLLPYCPEWRYGLEGSSMLWYPSAVLLRQPAVGAWEQPLDEVRGLLRRRLHEDGQAAIVTRSNGGTRG